VSLSPEAHHKAIGLAASYAVEVEYWPTPDPSLVEGSREQMLDAYRSLRDGLFRRIKQHFPLTGGRESSRLNYCSQSGSYLT
jgi:hypothetical protein